MAPRDGTNEIYQRLGALERHQVRMETEMPEVRKEVSELGKTVSELDAWRVEVKVTVAKWIGFYGAVAVIGQFLLTALLQKWLSNH